MKYIKCDDDSCTYRIDIEELNKMLAISDYVANHFDHHDQFLIEISKDNALSIRNNIKDALSTSKQTLSLNQPKLPIIVFSSDDQKDCFVVEKILDTAIELRIGYHQKLSLLKVCSYPADIGQLIPEFSPKFTIEEAHQIADEFTKMSLARLQDAGIDAPLNTNDLPHILKKKS